MRRWLGLAVLWGCGRGRRVDPPPPVAAVAAPEAPVAGRLEDGVFYDVEHGVSLALPPPWEAEVGQRAEGPRVRARHPLAEVELWVHPAGVPLPRPRSDCAWTFVDRAPGGILVGSCTSGRPQDPLRMAWVWPLAGGAVELDARVGPAALAAGDREVRALLSGLRAADGGPAGPAGAP